MATARQLWDLYKISQTFAFIAWRDEPGNPVTYEGRRMIDPQVDTYWWGRCVSTELYCRGENITPYTRFRQLVSDRDANSPVYRALMRSSSRTLHAFIKRLDKQATKQFS